MTERSLQTVFFFHTFGGVSQSGQRLCTVLCGRTSQTVVWGRSLLLLLLLLRREYELIKVLRICPSSSTTTTTTCFHASASHLRKNKIKASECINVGKQRETDHKQ